MKKPQSVDLARGLRRNQYDAEAKLWFYLHSRLLQGVKFRRQRSLGNYIVDFVSFERKLIIEIDGGQHSETPTLEKDSHRTKWLEEHGFQVIRFWNNDVLLNIDGVGLKILELIEVLS